MCTYRTIEVFSIHGREKPKPSFNRQSQRTIGMPKIAVNDIEIHYEIHGQGPQLLSISGTGGDLRNKPNIFDFPLVETFTVLSYDQRGFGQTSKPDQVYSMKDYADDAAVLLDALDWDQCRVMGTSFGGMVAQELVLTQPQKVSRLALLCTSSGGKGGASYPLQELECLPVKKRAVKMLEIANTHWDEKWRQQNQKLYDDILEMRIRQTQFVADNPELLMGSRRQLEARQKHDTYDRLPSISVPTAIFGGKYDGIAPPDNLENLQKQIPNAILEFYEGGHAFFLQDPQAFARLIAFLKE